MSLILDEWEMYRGTVFCFCFFGGDEKIEDGGGKPLYTVYIFKFQYNIHYIYY